MHRTASARFAIRKGDRVFIDAPGGDANEGPDGFKKERGHTEQVHPGELFCLRSDPCEGKNLYNGHSGKVVELSRNARTVQTVGRVKGPSMFIGTIGPTSMSIDNGLPLR